MSLQTVWLFSFAEHKSRCLAERLYISIQQKWMCMDVLSISKKEQITTELVHWLMHYIPSLLKSYDSCVWGTDWNLSNLFNKKSCLPSFSHPFIQTCHIAIIHNMWKPKASGTTVIKPGAMHFQHTIFELNVFEDSRVVADGKISHKQCNFGVFLTQSYCITSED